MSFMLTRGNNAVAQQFGDEMASLDDQMAGILDREMSIDKMELAKLPEDMNDDNDERRRKHLNSDGLEMGAPVDAYIYNENRPFPRELLPYKLPSEESKLAERKKEAFASMFRAPPGSRAKLGAFKDTGGVIGGALHAEAAGSGPRMQMSGRQSEFFDHVQKTYEEQIVQPLGDVAQNAAQYVKEKAQNVKNKVDDLAARTKARETFMTGEKMPDQAIFMELYNKAYMPGNRFVANCIADMREMWDQSKGNLGKEFLVAEVANEYILPTIAMVWPALFYYTLENMAAKQIAPSWWVQDPLPNVQTESTYPQYIAGLGGIPGASEELNIMLGLDPAVHNIKHHCTMNADLECVD